MYNKFKQVSIVVLVFGLGISCNNSKKVEEDIENSRLELEVLRFDTAFANAQPTDIPELKQKFPYLFPAQYPDSVWVAKLRDTLQIELRNEVRKAFDDFNEEKEDLELLFKHIAYYFPEFPVPSVLTVTSDVQYDNRVILTDTLLLIGLDNYLGPEHRFYGGIDRYIAERLDRKYLVSDVCSAFAKKVIQYPRDRTFLSQMIFYGKELYMKDLLIPFKTDKQKIGYAEDDFQWAVDNEEQVWRYFIEQELLYSTDNKLAPRFLDPAPFSKFRLALDNDSPGQIGRYMGWQIVRAFMNKNDVNLKQMLRLPADEIFKKSNYKPKK